MKLAERLEQSVREIERNGLKYALAGGLVASLYRKEPRATADIDLVILTGDVDQARAILKALGLKPHPLRQAELEGGPMFSIKKKNTPVFLLCGRSPDRADAIGVDLILSGMPWTQAALERAQANRVDFGFGGIPCLTLEDFVLSKLYSVRNQSTRFMDLDDLRSIFESTDEIDWVYVVDGMRRWELPIPDALKIFVPKQVLKAYKK